MDRLDDTARRRFLAGHTDWDLEGETLRRTFVFTDFNEAMGFVVRVALAAEAADHHPDLHIRWNRVTVALTTHSAGSLTAKDVELAARIETLSPSGPQRPA